MILRLNFFVPKYYPSTHIDFVKFNLQYNEKESGK